jgi:hypothetical protein
MATRGCRAVACSMLVLGRTGKNCPGYEFSVGVWPEFQNPLTSKHGLDTWQPSLIYRDAIKRTVSCPLTEHTTKRKAFPLGLLKTWMRIIAVVIAGLVAERNTNDVSWFILAARWITVIAKHIPYPNWKQYIDSTQLESTAPTKHVLWTKSQSRMFFPHSWMTGLLVCLPSSPQETPNHSDTRQWQVWKYSDFVFLNSVLRKSSRL